MNGFAEDGHLYPPAVLGVGMCDGGIGKSSRIECVSSLLPNGNRRRSLAESRIDFGRTDMRDRFFRRVKENREVRSGPGVLIARVSEEEAGVAVGSSSGIGRSSDVIWQ